MILADHVIANPENALGLVNSGQTHDQADGGILDEVWIAAQFINASGSLQVLL